MYDLPLLELFNKLREAGIPLGVGEYQMVLQALQAGFGVSSRSELARLCCTLWVKSSEEKKIFNYYFNQIIPKESIPTVLNSEVSSSNKVVRNSENLRQYKYHQNFPQWKQYLVIGGTILLVGTFVVGVKLLYPFVNLSWSLPTLTIPSTETHKPIKKEPVKIDIISGLIIFSIVVLPLLLLYILFLFTLSRWERWIENRKNRYKVTYKVIPPIPQIKPSQVSLFSELIREISDEVQLARAVRQFNQDSEDKLNSLAAYIPVTRRQMKQSWRYLRCLVREGVPTELDLKATVNQIGRKGVLLNPVLIPRRVNRVQVLLLIDQGGSMMPFHNLAQRLVETAVQGGRLGKTGVYYFHNCPLDYLYRDATRLEAEPIDVILAKLHQSKTVAVVFSDAGATRGSLNWDRYQLTKIFIERLKQQVRYVAWLNPMPKARWLNTTAGEIAQVIPMFEADRQGLDSAINVLRGRYSYSKESSQ
ncbi:MAG: hypothetical protein RMY34_16895 [Aulosira sp. DedQUE10]|nr:hypothetical protein [Aulosira sp. DedQUE10]